MSFAHKYMQTLWLISYCVPNDIGELMDIGDLTKIDPEYVKSKVE